MNQHNIVIPESSHVKRRSLPVYLLRAFTDLRTRRSAVRKGSRRPTGGGVTRSSPLYARRKAAFADVAARFGLQNERYCQIEMGPSLNILHTWVDWMREASLGVVLEVALPAVNSRQSTARLTYSGEHLPARDPGNGILGCLEEGRREMQCGVG